MEGKSEPEADVGRDPAATLPDLNDDDEAKKGPTGIPKKVVVHPLVLLSVVDHFNRVAKDVDRDQKKRVCGILLGEIIGTKVDVTNSYAVPFEEDAKNPQTWYFDHNYHESMFAMFKKVNASERVVGWYSTGPLIRQADIDIHEVVRKYCPQPVLVIIDVTPKEDQEIPTKAYYSVPAVPEAGSLARRAFVHLASEIGAQEAEEVGVEHLLREIKDVRISTISDVVGQKLASLKALDKRMLEMHEYLDNVCKGVLPPNPRIIYNIQDIFNLCPDMKAPALAKAFAVKSHDSLMVMYVSALLRSIAALHDLITNKLLNRAAERSEAEKRALLAASKRMGDNEADNMDDDEADLISGGAGSPGGGDFDH